MASTFIVYDSVFGNTAEVARAIGDELGKDHSARVVEVHTATPSDLVGADLIVVGSPTRGFRPTPQIQEFIASIGDRLAGLAAAAFDTRIDPDTIHPAPLRWVVEVGGYASEVLNAELKENGAIEAGPPAGFLVTGTEGPLNAGELERARSWARSLKRQDVVRRGVTGKSSGPAVSRSRRAGVHLS